MTSHQVPQELDTFLKTLADSLAKAIAGKVLPAKWLASDCGNQESWLHARVLAFMAKAGFDLDYVVEIESGFKPKDGRRFRPDLQRWKSNHHSFLVE